MIIIKLDNGLDEWRLETQRMYHQTDDDDAILTSAELDEATTLYSDTENYTADTEPDHHDDCDDDLFTDQDDYTTLYI